MAKETEALLKIKTILDESGLTQTDKSAKAAAASVSNIGKQASFSNSLMKRLIGTGALVAAAFKAIQATVRFISSAISDSVKNNEALNNQATKVNEQWGKFKSFVGDALSSLIESTGVLNAIPPILNAVVNGANLVWNALKAWNATLLSGVLAPLEKILSVAGLFSNYAKEASESIQGWRTVLQESASEAANNLKWQNDILATQQDNVKVLAARKKAEEEAAAAAKKAAEDAQKYRENLIKFERDTRIRSASETAKQLQEIAASQNAYELDDLQQRLSKERELRLADFETKKAIYSEDLILNQQQYDELLIQQEAYNQQYETLETALNQRRMEEGMKLSEFEKYLNTQRGKNMLDTLSYISSLSESNSKELQVIGKTAASATATIDTYKAANVALASAPPPFNYGLAAAVMLAGFANVAKINGVALADGGIVKATTGGVPAIMAEAGVNEMALPLKSSAIDPFAKAIANSMGGSVEITQNINIQNGNDMPTIIEALRQGTIEALELANLTIQIGNKQSGLAV